MNTWIGRSAPPGSRTRRPTSTLPFSATERLPEAGESVVEGCGAEWLPADRPTVGDHRAVAHYVEASLRGADQPRARDLDPGVHALVGGVVAGGADLGQPTLTPNGVHLRLRLVQRLIERLELLPLDLRSVADRDLPAHAPRRGRFGRLAGGPVIFSGPSRFSIGM